MEALELIRRDFDFLENREPEYEKQLGIFVSESGMSASSKIYKFLE